MASSPYPIILLLPQEEEYPYLLQQIRQPPAPLYCRGNTARLSGPSLSVVGSRKMSDYGERVLRLLIPPLAEAGLVIVSGLAYGVDSRAHALALGVGGSCVAVLGSGLDVLYPERNRGLAEDILNKDGCIVSEYPPNTEARPYYFPARNRIVAGLSMATLIIEAGERSGTLSTARHALEEGREVGVVPADIQRPNSLGVHTLLKQGARPVTSAQDILDLYNLQLPLLPYGRTTVSPALTGTSADLYDLISCEGVTLDELIVRSKLPVAEVQRTLSALEVAGKIIQQGPLWHPISLS